VSSALIHDTVLNNGSGSLDATQDGMDGSGYMLPTQSAAIEVGGADAAGLPEDAFFPADANHPDVRLHWTNADNGPNSRVMKAPGDSFSFAVRPRIYIQVQIYALSTHGTSIVEFTLHYSDGSTTLRKVTFPDWLTDPAASGQFFLVNGLDRYKTGSFQSNHDCAISGVNLDPDQQKILVSVTVAQPVTDWFVFYGATAW
jgi:hypothetical protein